LMSFEGTSASTAVTAVTGMDGIYRFETPESLVAFFGLAVPHKESAHKKTGVGTFTKKTKPRRGLQLGLRPQNSGSIHRIKVDIVVRHGPQVWANGIPPVRLQMGPVGLEMATVSAKLLPIIAPYGSKRLLLMQEPSISLSIPCLEYLMDCIRFQFNSVRTIHCMCLRVRNTIYSVLI
ncbi:MAG: IS110 family transposase, partial [Thermoplasmata archaeon]|nr:IS110 family transposase [Thermoplasmata archaeon]